MATIRLHPDCRANRHCDAGGCRYEKATETFRPRKAAAGHQSQLVPGSHSQYLALLRLRDGARGFEHGPIDLVLQKGEILFVTGENGSGKTTLVKLLLGLYPLKHGEIRLNGERVTDAKRDDYRQNFSAIFFDFYLFDDLIVADEAASEAVRCYLERLNIARKVTVEEGRLSTLELSTGQRKRLALIGTYLEERPIVVFDEWAAEQDPTFRRIFYTEILQELRRQGKTLVVVSHDDRYFGAADKILKFKDGRIAEMAVSARIEEDGA